MSLVPLKTSISAKQPAFVPYFSTGQLNASTISTGSIIANSAEISSILNEYLSTVTIDAEYINNSTINTLHVDLDGQILTASATELLLNGVPIATQSSLSTISEWSYFPAISTVAMAGNDLDQGGTLSSLNVRAGNGFFLNLVAFNSLFVSSNTSTISSVIDSADIGIFSTLNAGMISCMSISSLIGSVSSVIADEGIISSISTNSVAVAAGGTVELQNFGASFASVGSAQLAFDWYYLDGNRTDMFYDTTISSVRVMTKTPGGYTDNPASRVHMPVAGISTLDVSSMTTNFISTPQLFVSSINGSEFTSTGITVQVAGVSSLVANSISSVGAEIRNALVSTIQFKPSFDVGFNFDTAALGNALQGGLTRLGVGAGVGAGIVGSGLLGAIFSRPANTSYNTNAYYQYATPTQLQFSTLGADTSTFTRLVSSSGASNEVPGVEFVLSSIISSGTLCLRSLGDPTNLADPSTFTSSIQAFGEWVPVPPETLQVISSFASASISSLEVSSINGLDTASLENISTFNNLNASSINTSSISTAIIYGANNNLFGIGIQGLEIQTSATGQVWISSPQTNVAGLANCSTVGATNVSARNGGFSSLTVSSASVSTLTIAGLSSIVFSTSGTAGLAAQPAGRLLISGNDLDLGQQDLWAQQVRVGAGNPSGSAQTEVIWYSPDNLTTRGLGLGGADLTLRIQSTINSGTNNGYLLDTAINKPFFSTINNSTCMMATLPSTSLGVFGVSTLAVIPPIQVYGGFYSSTTQGVAGANVATPLTYSSESVNVGGFTFAGSTITIPAPGTYEIGHSIQFATTTNSIQPVYFWFKKNGADVPQSASLVTIAKDNEVIGTVSILDTAVAGDKYGVAIASPDTNMTAAALPISSFCPAIPSLITNIKRL